MDCLLHLAAMCLLSPTELAIRANVSTQIAGQMQYRINGHNYHGGIVGHLGIEMPLVSTRHFAITAGYTHQSLLNTRGDRGEERALLGLVWKPAS